MWRYRPVAAMVLSTQDILLKHVCPGLGVGIAFIMFMSPLKVCEEQ